MTNENKTNDNNEELKKLIINNKKIKKYSRIFGLIGIIATTIGLSASIFTVFETTVSRHGRSSNNKTELNDFLKSESLRKERVQSIVIQFIESFDKPSSQFLTDTIRQYYLKKNLIYKDVEWHQRWHKRHFPRAKVIVNKNDIVINLSKADTVEVFVNGIYYPDSLKESENIVYQLKLNRENKIFYVRNLVAKD
jgi:uncharacterized iron-regulated protein